MSPNRWEVFWLAEVKLQEGETLENALRRFKRKVQQEDIIKEVKRHSFYLKPGEKKRAKQELARNAGGKQRFPSSLPRAGRFTAASASLAGKRKRPAPGKPFSQFC